MRRRAGCRKHPKPVMTAMPVPGYATALPPPSSGGSHQDHMATYYVRALVTAEFDHIGRPPGPFACCTKGTAGQIEDSLATRLGLRRSQALGHCRALGHPAGGRGGARRAPRPPIRSGQDSRCCARPPRIVMGEPADYGSGGARAGSEGIRKMRNRLFIDGHGPAVARDCVPLRMAHAASGIQEPEDARKPA
jgi:hypothetical protein